MVKTVPSSIAAQLLGLPTDNLTLSRCCKLVLRDGTEFGFTDHDAPLYVSLSSDLSTPVMYRADEGLIVGDIDLALGLHADNTEISLPFGGITRLRHLVGRRLNHAKVYIFDVDWAAATPIPMELMKGQVSDARGEGPLAVLEVRSQSDYWNQVIGELMSPRCSADFGDERCKKIIAPETAIVTAVESTQRFSIDLVHPDNFFRFGTVQFTTGDLAGVWKEEIYKFEGLTGTVELVASLPDAPEVGDELEIAVGCSRLKVSDDASIQTCATYDNVPNFRGFDRVPGSDIYFRMPIPGQGNS